MSRARLASAVITAAVAATVVATAAPSSAGGKNAKSTDYAAAWTFDGGVVADLKRNMKLTDYLSSEYYDRSTGTPARGEAGVILNGQPCKVGSYFESGLGVYGATTTWANVAPGPDSQMGARMRLACTYDGQVHHVRWGALDNNCLKLIRQTLSTWTLSAEAGCPAKDQIVDKAGEPVGDPVTVDIPFTATLTVTGEPPVR